MGIGLSQEDGFELIHAGVGEEQRGVVEGSAGRRGLEGVLSFLDKVIDKRLTDSVGRPFLRIGWDVVVVVVLLFGSRTKETTGDGSRSGTVPRPCLDHRRRRLKGLDNRRFGR